MNGNLNVLKSLTFEVYRETKKSQGTKSGNYGERSTIDIFLDVENFSKEMDQCLDAMS